MNPRARSRLMVFVSALFLAGAAAATEQPAARQLPESLVVEGKAAEPHRPRPGEVCLVCNTAVASGDYVYLVEGQRVPVHARDCDAALRASPARFLAQLKPRGAFLGASSVYGGASWVWFGAGLYVLAGLVFGALCAHQALARGHNAGRWFAAGFFFLLFGYVALLVRPRRAPQAPPGLDKARVTPDPQRCPACGAWSHPSAPRCPECGAALAAGGESEARRVL